MIEEIDSEEQSILENIIGHVRIRRSVKKEELESMTDNLKHFVNSTDCLEFDNGNVIYKETSISNDYIPNEYLAVSDGIRRVRLRNISSPSPLIVPYDFLDESNITPAYMVRKPYVAETILNAIWDEEELVGEKNVQMDVEPSMGGEDFSYLLNEKPGSYLYIGQGDVDHKDNLHTTKYDFNDDLLPIGVNYWVNLVKNFFQK